MRALIMWLVIIAAIVWSIDKARFIMVNSQFSGQARADKMEANMEGN